jgi:prophage maintenance system killer protein
MRELKDIILYRSGDGSVQLDVQLELETVWLTLNQLSDLFGRDKSVISRHLRNVYEEAELDREATVAKFATVQGEGGRSVTRSIEYYNLDAIISVGYRVNSKRGTEFRIWASSVLKQHLIQGYSVNEKRLEALKKTLKLAADVSRRKELSGDEGAALLQIVSDYAYALDLLDDYDYQRVALRGTSSRETVPITRDEVIRLVEQMRERLGASQIFGIELNESLDGSLGAIMQTFDGEDLYPSVEEKAAHLLYFVVKNHSFIDGNKRIAAAAFLRFAEKNGLIFDDEGNRRIADNALVAMTLLIAESDPKEKDVITTMLTNLIAGK